ncbi:MAG: ankyrin repeat domain-containing protein, partial [Thermoguttaceae bacterium]
MFNSHDTDIPCVRDAFMNRDEEDHSVITERQEELERNKESEDSFGQHTETAKKSAYQDIFEAVANGTVEDVRYFIEQGADVNAKNKKGRTPLHIAAKNNVADAIAALLEAGANIEARNKYIGRTPLHIAAKNNAAEAIAALVKAGSNIEAKNNAG